jgi:hypothetical protein
MRLSTGQFETFDVLPPIVDNWGLSRFIWLEFTLYLPNHMNLTPKRACPFLVAMFACMVTSSCTVHTPDTFATPASDIQTEIGGVRALNLGRGIQLSIPSTWTIASNTQKDQMRADVRQYLGSEAEGAAPLLFDATSGPGWEVESISVNMKAPASFKPSDIRRVAARLPQALSGEIEKSTRELLQRVGCRLTRFDGTTVQEFSGYPAIVSTYEYARGTTRKRGRQMIVYTDTHEITITQSTPVERGNEGVARMDWIRDSIRIQ